MLFLPELILLGIGLIFFFVSLGRYNERFLRNLSTGLGAIVVAATFFSINQRGDLFFHAYRIDLFSQFFKLLISGATLIVLIFCGRSPGIRPKVKGEYLLFLFISELGLMLLVSSVELLSVFVSLELSSFALYIMVPMRESSKGTLYQTEAGIKYLLFGIMATAFMLFGMSYLFGLTGSTYLDRISTEIPYIIDQPATIIALFMVMTGFFYKLAIVPFHFWVPDVYEGGANETISFIAAVPKIAAIALLLRLIKIIGTDGPLIVNLLLFCSIGSMFLGNLSALVQKDLKRMLGYSGISHGGFILFGLLTFQLDGYATALYYTIGYAVMSLACFLVICTVASDGQNLRIEELTGLYKRSPLLAFTLTIALFALAGIPPFVGFSGKLMLLISGLKQGYIIPVILAAFNTALALFYYLSVVRITYCTDPQDQCRPIQTGFLNNAAALFLLFLITGMGIMPTRILELAKQTILSIL
ncbi:MAG: NADH-quinone oxidoreductase subunit N [Desulfobacterales bacterium]|nr:MAG: NADH-quinone oxidoreductase subunit N [Desulfobacterales bacterium]